MPTTNFEHCQPASLAVQSGLDLDTPTHRLSTSARSIVLDVLLRAEQRALNPRGQVRTFLILAELFDNFVDEWSAQDAIQGGSREFEPI